MKRILVIEDSPDVRATICEILEARGWHALTAEDGEQGLALATSQLPDLVLCDIRMPRKDGYAVLRELRANPPTASMPFVFLTGLSDKPNMRQGMELGADDYIVKPFTPEELCSAVESRLRKQQAVMQMAERRLTELRSTLNSALPHELVTPLNTILGFSSLIMDSPELGLKAAREYAGHILEAGERLHKLIERFVFFSQLELAASDPERQGMFSHPEPIPLPERLSVIAQRCASEAHRENDLSLELQEVTARIAQSHLDRLTQELVRNAFKFSEPGTPVQVATQRSNGLTSLCVTNQGRGFTPQQISSIGAHLQFDRELQEQQGTGLGLAIVRRLAELYQGSFWIQSTPGGPHS